jgi:hypothetical protein
MGELADRQHEHEVQVQLDPGDALARLAHRRILSKLAASPASTRRTRMLAAS